MCRGRMNNLGCLGLGGVDYKWHLVSLKLDGDVIKEL